MQAYEDLIRDWGVLAGISIVPGPRQVCCVLFPEEHLTLHIDLDRSGEKLLLGCNLGILNPGVYRKKILVAALKSNSLSTSPRGILAFSSKLGSLVLFQYLALMAANPQKLQKYVQEFRNHAKLWAEALQQETIPEIKGVTSTPTTGGMFGLKS